MKVADLRLSTQALTSMHRVYDGEYGALLASDVAVLRERVLARAAGNPERVYPTLRQFKGFGVKTAAAWCVALGFPVPPRGRHCPSCTCWRH